MFIFCVNSSNGLADKSLFEIETCIFKMLSFLMNFRNFFAFVFKNSLFFAKFSFCLHNFFFFLEIFAFFRERNKCENKAKFSRNDFSFSLEL